MRQVKLLKPVFLGDRSYTKEDVKRGVIIEIEDKAAARLIENEHAQHVVSVAEVRRAVAPEAPQRAVSRPGQ